MNYAIIIPVLNPDKKTTDFVDTLIAASFKNIIVIDDGSNEDSQKYFREIEAHPECTLLVHEVNKGKGAALKTAFRFLADNRSDIDAAVTADGDGQHNIDCLNGCIKAYEESPGTVIFGGRDFNEKNIPARSRFGNKVSSVVYRFSCGIKLVDTQTGLRIIPAKHFDKFSNLAGDRYEYETNMILAIAGEGLEYKEIPIETIYIDDNASSHFNPIKDSAKIYILVLKNIIKFLINSLICWLIDEGLFWLFKDAILFTAMPDHTGRNMTSMLIARVLSSAVNFTMNRKTVFKSKESVAKTAAKYYILAACMLAASMLLVDIFAVKLLNLGGFPEVLVKCVVDIVLFLVSYTVQRKWVFKKSDDKKE